MVAKPGGTMANNKPVGDAGQPWGNLKKEVPEGKAGAIQRRMAKMQDKKSTKVKK